jgi:hypothetical protein
MLERLRLYFLGLKTSTLVALSAIALAGLFAQLAVLFRFQRSPVVHAVEGALLFVVTAAFLVRAKLDRGVIVILLAGLGLYIVYLGYTSFGERNYDAGVQLEYIEYIVKHKARPPASKCLVCHHPPLYYYSGAVVYAFFKANGLVHPTVGLQLFGLVLILIFIGYGAATISLLVKDPRDQRIATALMVFWPYTFHNSVRLHNDSMACAWMAVACFYLVRWERKERPRDLFLTAIFTGLGLWTKSSAYVLVPVLGLGLVLKFFGSRDKLRLLLRGTAAVGIILGALVLNARGKNTPQAKNAPLCHKILGNACDIQKGQFVENKIQNYLYVDLPTFLHEPYAMAERDWSGRKYFWNHLLKSSLFGTHNTVPDRKTSYELNRYVAQALNILLLGMCAYLVIGALSGRTRAFRRYWVPVALVGSSIVFMAGFRALIPAPHHTDFRHVFHDVILVSLLYGATIGHFRKKKSFFERVGQVPAWTFVGLTIFYFLPKHDLAIRLTTHVVHRDIGKYSKVMPEGTPWDREANLLIEENQIVEFAIQGAPTASKIDVTFDNNDEYLVEIIGETTEALTIGPTKRKVKGLCRYVERLRTPVKGVHTVRVRALKGDMAYTMGHLILR